MAYILLQSCFYATCYSLQDASCMSEISACSLVPSHPHPPWAAEHKTMCYTETRSIIYTHRGEILHIINPIHDIQPAWWNHPAQSSEDTVQKACMTQSSTLSACISLSCSFRKAFTFEKHSSVGFRSGEYGGIKWTRAPVLWISEITLSVWWIEALSMRRTLCGLTPLKGSKCGRTLSSRNPRTLLHQQILWWYTHPTFHSVPLSLLLEHALRQSNCVSLARIPVEFTIAELFNYEGDHVLV